MLQQKIIPDLWFDTQAENAAAFYTSVFENSRIVSVTRYAEGLPGADRLGDDRGVRVGRTAVRRHQRRPPVHLRRGRLVSDPVRRRKRSTTTTGTASPRARASAAGSRTPTALLSRECH